MKKLLYVFALVFLFTAQLHSQEDRMIIKFTNGDTLAINILEISKMGIDSNAVKVEGQVYSPTEALKNYPNPFSESTTIEFDISGLSSIELMIYDMNGNMIYSAKKNNCSEGINTMIWNRRDNDGNMVSEGVYLIEARTARYSLFKKIVVIN